MSSRNFRESSSILKKEKTYSKKRRRSDPGPELLQPISARDGSPGVEDEYLDIDDSRLPISATQRGEIDDNESRSRRKKFRVFDVEADDEKKVPRQASKAGYRSEGSAKKLYPIPNRSAGYEAPLGMTFIPLCSACDESTDEATDEE